VQHPAQLTAAFRANGLKLTPQRQLLFRLLHENSTHPSAEALYVAASEQMPGISLRTVYQTLTDLVAMGELRQLSLGSGSARFDPNLDEHHHVLCADCGEVRDVYVDGAEYMGVDGLDGFEVDDMHIVFRGRCARCAADTSQPTTGQPTTSQPTTSRPTVTDPHQPTPGHGHRTGATR
jgi:Fe2+ or Zn2+ uptake regulation protein